MLDDALYQQPCWQGVRDAVRWRFDFVFPPRYLLPAGVQFGGCRGLLRHTQQDMDEQIFHVTQWSGLVVGPVDDPGVSVLLVVQLQEVAIARDDDPLLLGRKTHVLRVRLRTQANIGGGSDVKTALTQAVLAIAPLTFSSKCKRSCRSACGLGRYRMRSSRRPFMPALAQEGLLPSRTSLLRAEQHSRGPPNVTGPQADGVIIGDVRARGENQTGMTTPIVSSKFA